MGKKKKGAAKPPVEEVHEGEVKQDNRSTDSNDCQSETPHEHQEEETREKVEKEPAAREDEEGLERELRGNIQSDVNALSSKVDLLLARNNSDESALQLSPQAAEKINEIVKISISDAVADLKCAMHAAIEKSISSVTQQLVSQQQKLFEFILRQFEAQRNAQGGVVLEAMRQLDKEKKDEIARRQAIGNAALEEGKAKIRLQIQIRGDSSSSLLLVPVLQFSTVGEARKEAIRRAGLQGIISEFSSNAWLLTTAGQWSEKPTVLFDEDRLDEVGVDGSSLLALVSTKALVVQTTSSQPESQEEVKAETHSPHHQSNPDIVAQDLLASVFLDPTIASEVAERENLERRLNHEMERMEREPMQSQERLEHIGLLKKALSSVRLRLVDRATYCHNEKHRSVARGALDKLNSAVSGATSSVEDLEAARRVAEAALRELSVPTGEEARVSELESQAAVEIQRKERCIAELKELVFKISHQLRIPDTSLTRAEHLVDKAETCILLAPSQTRAELQQCCDELNQFVAAMMQP